MIKGSLEFTDKKLQNLINNLARATIEGAFDGCRDMLDEINQRSVMEYVIVANLANLEVLIRPITPEYRVEREKKIMLSEQVMVYRSKCYVVDLIKDKGREGGTQPIGWITAGELMEIFRRWKDKIALSIKESILRILR